MKRDRLMEQALRSEAAQRELRALIEEQGGPRAMTVVARVDRGSLIVWNPIGEGRLRFARPVPDRVHPPTLTEDPLGSGRLLETGLAFHDTYLTLDDIPLLLWRRNGCPSCQQLVRAAVERPAEVRRLTSAIHDITRDLVGDDLSNCLPALEWLFALLPSGLYRVSLDDYAPTAGDDRCAWGAFHAVERCDALREIFAPSPPRYLIPTQRLSAFRQEAWARARRRFRSHPGIALHLGGLASALLDGHHRALAAALERATLCCITITAASVMRPLPLPGERCAGPPRPLVVHFSPDRVTLPSARLPEKLGAYLDVLERCSPTRWLREESAVDELEAKLASEPPIVKKPPEVDIAGAYTTWDEQEMR